MGWLSRNRIPSCSTCSHSRLVLVTAGDLEDRVTEDRECSEGGSLGSESTAEAWRSPGIFIWALSDPFGLKTRRLRGAESGWARPKQGKPAGGIRRRGQQVKGARGGLPCALFLIPRGPVPVKPLPQSPALQRNAWDSDPGDLQDSPGWGWGYR